MAEPLLEARGIVKSFGRVRALRGANFTVYPGEVVALVGDNGAGKSTLVKTLAGVQPPDAGEILFEGRPVDDRARRSRRARLGIETVYQDLALARRPRPGRQPVPRPRGPARRACSASSASSTSRAMRRRSRRGVQEPRRRRCRTSTRAGGDDVRRPAPGRRGRRAVTWASKVVFMDEPTAALGVVQTRNVLDLIRRVRDRGLVGRADQPQHARGLRGRRPHRGAAPRRAGRALQARRRRRWRTSSAR